MTLKLDDRGDEVGAVQQQLVEAGEQVDAQELHQQFFGPSTKIAVVDFQSSHLGANNKPLIVDGLVGPATLLALANPRVPTEIFIADGWRGESLKAPNSEAMTAVLVSIGQIGNKEDPDHPNRGPQVDVYNGPDYIGAPWCANFASWCWRKTPSGSPFGVKASALKFKEWGTEHKCLVTTDEPVLPGDVAVLMRAEGRGHVGLVTGCEFDGKVSLIEGNCGNAVRGTVRDRKFWSHFVRPRR